MQWQRDEPPFRKGSSQHCHLAHCTTQWNKGRWRMKSQQHYMNQKNPSSEKMSKWWKKSTMQ